MQRKQSACRAADGSHFLDSGGRSEVAFIGGVEEYGTGIFFHLPGFPVQDADLFDAVVAHDYIFVFGIELAHGEDCNFIFLPVEHLFEDSCSDRRFEVVAVAAYFYLFGVCSVCVDIVLFHSPRTKRMG